MRPFRYSQARDTASAAQLLAANPSARFLAGGTNLLDLMKEDVERPDELIDITKLDLTKIRAITSGPRAGGIALGGLARNSETANYPLVRAQYPLLSQAILAGASGQIRNMATNGGNLMQRTRCPYFYDVSMPCNKRSPGSGCGAMEGINRMHSIFGWSEQCIAVYPSDMAVALAALDAVVKVAGAGGQTREIRIADFHRLPGDTPDKDNNLASGEIITGIELPKNAFAGKSYYLKVRDRASYAFALVSVGAGLHLKGTTILGARLAMGGVAAKPWRLTEAEQLLAGREISDLVFNEAAEVAMAGAKPLEHNRFKVELGKRSIVRALQMAVQA